MSSPACFLSEKQCLNNLESDNPKTNNQTVKDLQGLANSIQCEVEGRNTFSKQHVYGNYNKPARIDRGNIQIGELDTMDKNILSFFVKSWQQTSQVNIDKIQRKIEISGVDISNYPSISVNQAILDDDVFQSTIIELANFINKLKFEGVVAVNTEGQMEWKGGVYSTKRFSAFEEFLSNILNF